MPELKAWNGSTWTSIGVSPKAWNGSSWTGSTIGAIKAWNGSSWTTLWVKSDPLQYTFNPIWTASYQEASPYAKAAYTFTDPANDLIQGDWDDVGVAGGMQRATGVMRFNRSDILSTIGGRTTVTDATLRLQVRYEYTSLGIYPYVYGADASAPASEPATLNGGIVRWGSPRSGARTRVGDTVDINVNDLAQALIDGSIYGFAVYNSGTSTASKELYRGGFYGGTNPTLYLTVDY